MTVYWIVQSHPDNKEWTIGDRQLDKPRLCGSITAWSYGTFQTGKILAAIVGAHSSVLGLISSSRPADAVWEIIKEGKSQTPLTQEDIGIFKVGNISQKKTITDHKVCQWIDHFMLFEIFHSVNVYESIWVKIVLTGHVQVFMITQRNNQDVMKSKQYTMCLYTQRMTLYVGPYWQARYYTYSMGNFTICFIISKVQELSRIKYLCDECKQVGQSKYQNIG